MSLDWNLTKIDQYETKCWIGEGDDRQLNPVTEGLIWSTMIIGMGEITEANVTKFADRLAAYERGGSMTRVFDANDQLVDRPLTLQDVRDHIGLHTNVFPMLTDARWERKLGQIMMDRAKSSREYAERLAREAAAAEKTDA